MKQCSYCNQLKPETAFNWKQKHLKRASHCKICSRKQIRSHYKKLKNVMLDVPTVIVVERQNKITVGALNMRL
jgi:hypothetical protein